MQNSNEKVLVLTVLFLIVTLFQSCKTPALIATQTIEQADEYNNQRKYNEAIVYYEKYISLAPSLGVYRNTSMEADVFRKLAHAYSVKGKYDSSLFYLQKALKIDSTIPQNSLQVIEDFRKIGITYGYTGNYSKSIQYLKKSLILNEGMEKSFKDVKLLSIGDTYLSLAQVCFVTGDFQEALIKVEQAINIYKKIDNEFLGLLESYLLLGKIKIEQGNTQDGLKLIETSIKIAEKNKINTSRHLQAIGSAYLADAEYEKALKTRLEALKMAKESKIVSQISWMNVKVGDVYSIIGDDKKAESYYETALFYISRNESQEMAIKSSLQMRLGDVQNAYDISFKSGSLMSAGLASMRLGEMNQKDGKNDLAEHYFYKSDSIFDVIGSKAGQVNAKLSLSRLYIDKNNLKEANRLLEQIKKSLKNPEFEWQYFFEKGRIHERQKNIDSAYQAYSKAIDIIEKIRGQFTIEEFRSDFMKDKMNVYERMIMLLIENSESGSFIKMKQSPVMMAYYYSERAKSRAFLDILGNTKIHSKKSSDTVLLAKEYKLRIQIQKVAKEIQENDLCLTNSEELEKYLDVLSKEYLKTVDLVKLSNSEYQSLITVEPPRLSDVQKVIPDKSAIIEYWVGQDKLVIWLITNEKISAKILKTDKKEISELVKNCRSSIQPYSNTDYDNASFELYLKLISPIEAEISKFESLYIIPHRNLHFVPFQALIDKNDKYLIEKYNIAYSPSTAVLKYCSSIKKADDNNFLGMALGNIPLEKFSALPGTKIELNQIIQLYPGATAKFENETSETFFKQEANKYNILHIATHGLLNAKNPLNSYLLMLPDNKNDGQLSVNEIFELNLYSKLIVLSACETGLGRLSSGDELIGLSRAFIYAGTPAIIVSLWPVDDASTALLMTRLHQYYTAGYKIQNALTLAQRDLINNNFNTSVKRGANSVVWDDALKSEIISGNKSKKRNPFFWAPFILIGFGD